MLRRWKSSGDPSVWYLCSLATASASGSQEQVKVVKLAIPETGPNHAWLLNSWLVLIASSPPLLSLEPRRHALSPPNTVRTRLCPLVRVYNSTPQVSPAIAVNQLTLSIPTVFLLYRSILLASIEAAGLA